MLIDGLEFNILYDEGSRPLCDLLVRQPQWMPKALGEAAGRVENIKDFQHKQKGHEKKGSYEQLTVEIIRLLQSAVQSAPNNYR